MVIAAQSVNIYNPSNASHDAHWFKQAAGVLTGAGGYREMSGFCHIYHTDRYRLVGIVSGFVKLVLVKTTWFIKKNVTKDAMT